MHSTIYEFSEQPISESQRATIDSLPEWFFQTVADSAADTDEITRAVQIRCLEQHFGDLCIRDGDSCTSSATSRLGISETVIPILWRQYRLWQRRPTICSAASYQPLLSMAALSSVTESYADRFGFYVYDADHAELFPLDAWLRTADLSKPYFVGSVIDYHGWMNTTHQCG